MKRKNELWQVEFEWGCVRTNFSWLFFSCSAARLLSRIRKTKNSNFSRCNLNSTRRNIPAHPSEANIFFFVAKSASSAKRRVNIQISWTNCDPLEGMWSHIFTCFTKGFSRILFFVMFFGVFFVCCEILFTHSSPLKYFYANAMFCSIFNVEIKFMCFLW